MGGLLTLSGTYLAHKLKEKKEHQDFVAKKAIYHKLIVQEFEKAMMILNNHNWNSNPYKDIDYKFSDNTVLNLHITYQKKSMNMVNF